MQADFEYAACIVVFINHVIKCSIKLEDEAKALQPNILSAFFDELNLSFILKLDLNSNAMTMRFQMLLLIHNIIYYKYRTTRIGQYRFDFLCLINK